ncbi:Hypothetical protein A7982_11655 [Minicystis rosea]|nr:Hypothetical protein A7982_11655 [Minicystis rosea]
MCQLDVTSLAEAPILGFLRQIERVSRRLSFRRTMRADESRITPRHRGRRSRRRRRGDRAYWTLW